MRDLFKVVCQYVGQIALKKSTRLRAQYHGLFNAFGKNVFVGKGCRFEGQSIHIGDEVTIDADCILASHVKLGSHIYINRRCILSSNVTLEDNVLVGYNSVIFGDSRALSNNPACRGANPIQAPVVIERGVMLGANVTVLPGSRIGEGTVIAAGAVVNGYCEPNSIYAGNPAKKIKALPIDYSPKRSNALSLPGGQSPTQNAIILLYPDMLGDYILFRNHLEYLKQNYIGLEHPLYFISNAAVRSLIEFIDPDVADGFTWIDNFRDIALTPRKAMKLFMHKKQWAAKREELNLPERAHQLWCPSTAPWVCGGINVSIEAERKLGKDVQDPKLHQLQERFYGELFEPQSYYDFIFEQHRQFFEKATGKSFAGSKFSFPKERFIGQYQGPVDLNSPYCVIFPDSAETYKEWPPEYLAKAAEYILEKSNLNVYICGHKDKRYLGEEVRQRVKSERIINMMGDTDLVTIFDVLGRSKFVVCMDSFALHATNAMARPVICLTEGLYKGRYLPYPEQYRLSSHTYIYSAPGQPFHSLRPETVYPYLDKQLADIAPSVMV
jgi:acetyltransferase-like isoleucine patch superfamily enzyme/ADP-heptose:LPS heptosyltransferase